MAKAGAKGARPTSGPPDYYLPRSRTLHGSARRRHQPDDQDRRARPVTDPGRSTGGAALGSGAIVDTKEKYDCVIVGAGASGISAAKSPWTASGGQEDPESIPDSAALPPQRFHIPNAANGGADVRMTRNGGTVNLDSIGSWNQDGPSGIPGSYGQPAARLCLAGSTRRRWRSGRTAGPRASRPPTGSTSASLFPSAESSGPTTSSGPQRRSLRRSQARDRRGLDGVPRAHAVLRTPHARRSSAVQTTVDEDSSPTRSGAPLTGSRSAPT